MRGIHQHPFVTGGSFLWEWTGVYLDYVTVEDSGGGGSGDGNGDAGDGSFNNLVVTVSGCSPTVESITGSEDFFTGCTITVGYTGDIPSSGDTISVIYKPTNQLLKTLEI